MHQNDDVSESDTLHQTAAAAAGDRHPLNDGSGASAAELNAFKAIWIRPRETVRAIIAGDPNRHVVLLVCLAGVGASLAGIGQSLPGRSDFGIPLDGSGADSCLGEPIEK
jgi:hypothetical protein